MNAAEEDERQKLVARAVELNEPTYVFSAMRVEESIVKSGLTLALFDLLLTLTFHRRLLVLQAAELVGRDRSTVVRLADRLEERGLLRRYRDTTDNRLVWLEVTPKGEEAVGLFRHAQDEMLRAVFGRMSVEDLRGFVKNMVPFAKAISEFIDESPPGAVRRTGVGPGRRPKGERQHRTVPGRDLFRPGEESEVMDA